MVSCELSANIGPPPPKGYCEDILNHSERQLLKFILSCSKIAPLNVRIPTVVLREDPRWGSSPRQLGDRRASAPSCTGRRATPPVCRNAGAFRSLRPRM